MAYASLRMRESVCSPRLNSLQNIIGSRQKDFNPVIAAHRKGSRTDIAADDRIETLLMHRRQMAMAWPAAAMRMVGISRQTLLLRIVNDKEWRFTEMPGQFLLYVITTSDWETYSHDVLLLGSR